MSRPQRASERLSTPLEPENLDWWTTSIGKETIREDCSESKVNQIMSGRQVLPADPTFLLIYEFYRKMYILRESSILQSCTIGKFMYSSNYLEV